MHNTMLRYSIELALRSFRRNRILTALMILAIALGIGASMTTLTVLHVLSADPLPGKSHRLYRVQLDPQSLENYMPGAEPDEQLTRYDAEALWHGAHAKRQALMTGGHVAITPARPDVEPFYATARYTSADFFSMFDVPWVDGGPWGIADDDARARLAVVSRQLADKLFGGERPVGRSLRIGDHDVQIIGVVDAWRPAPRFYDLHDGTYGETEQVFLPISTALELELRRHGLMNCWDDVGDDETSLTAPCSWIQYWVELDSPDEANAYRDTLIRYSEDQRTAGRFQRPSNVRLRNVMEWLDFKQVVPGDVRLQNYLAFGFLLVCLINTVGLLLAKFLRRSAEISVRRALGASRSAIFVQFLVEAITIGLIGGVLGLGLTFLGLAAVRMQPSGYEHLVELDGRMLAGTFALTLVASILAGILPAWRACQVVPATQLKTQ